MHGKLFSLVTAGLLIAWMGGMAAASHTGEDRDRGECETGKPVMVAQRNEAAHQIRAAYKDEHHRLADARGGKAVDHKAANAVLRDADRELREVVAQALDDVAALTLGRNGHLRDRSPEPTGTPTPTPVPTPTPTPTAKPTCAPTASPTSGTDDKDADVDHGRTPVVLGAGLQLIVDEAISEMKAITDKALADVGALPAAEHKGAKPSALPSATDREGRGKSEGKAKPSDVPRHR